MEGPDGHHVARADDSGRRLRLRKQLFERSASALGTELGVGDELVAVDAGAPERGRPSGGLQLGRQVMLWPGDETDALVTELEEVLRRDLAGGPLVDADGGDVEGVDGAVNKDDPRAFVRELEVVAMLAAQIRHLAADEDHSLDATVEQH